jgi:cell division protein FtsL
MGLERCREYVSLLGLGILVFLCVLLISWQHLQCVRAGYEIEDLKAQRVTLQESNYQLRLRQAARADPQRIDTQARKLGMVSPSPQQVIPWGGTDVPSLSRAKSRPIVRPPTTVGDGNRREP